jgi:hypothetical protein
MAIGLVAILGMINKINAFAPVMMKYRTFLLHKNLRRCIYSRRDLGHNDFTLEHIIPKSLLKKENRNKKFNLFPCDKEINVRRKTYPFRETPRKYKSDVQKVGFYLHPGREVIYINNEAQGIVGRCALRMYKLEGKNPKWSHIISYKQAEVWARKNKMRAFEQSISRTNFFLI